MRTPLTRRLPDFPWDRLAAAKETARSHPDGIVDLSIGTPVDPTPEVARRALTEAADSPGYPQTIGVASLRSAMVENLSSRWGVRGLTEDATLPVVGTKELVASLPTQLGLGAGDRVVIPELAYPTYDVGARLAGADVVACDDPAELADISGTTLIWINSPSNPTGEITPPQRLAEWVEHARRTDSILVSDECYLDFGWDAEPVSVLHPDICGDDHRGLISVQSLSKRSNLAGYRAGFIAGDPDLVAELTLVRKHAGLMMPGPVQHAMAVTLADDEHVQQQRRRYLDRRALLKPALQRAGFSVEHDQGSLYLWASRTVTEDGRPRQQRCDEMLDFLASLGILVAPGDFYGPKGDTFVRVGLTGTDERIAAASVRLGGCVS